MGRRINILILHRSDAFARDVEARLREAGVFPNWQRLDTVEGLRRAAKPGGWDAIVCDDGFDIDATAMCETIVAKELHVPFIVIANDISLHRAVTLMKMGVGDILRRDQLGRLADVIETELRNMEVRRRLEEAQSQNWQLANFDELTGLPNRRLFSDRLDNALRRSRRIGSPVTLLYLDLDGFKDVNDGLGHAAGDKVLKETALRLRASIREYDTAARLAGDEFAMVLADLPGKEAMENVAIKVLDRLGEPIHVDGHDLHIDASIGIAVYPNDGDDRESLLHNADIAMYRSKRNGRKRYAFFSPHTVDEVYETADRRRSTIIRPTWPMAAKVALVAGLVMIAFSVGTGLVETYLPNGLYEVASESPEDLGRLAPAAGPVGSKD